MRGHLVLLALLALPACVATNVAPLSPPGLQSHGALRGCTDVSVGLAPARWWQCLGDAQLSALIESALEQLPVPSLTSARNSLCAAIAGRYIALRAQQTVLVLLAARADLDSQLAIIAGQHITGGAAPRQPVEAAKAQLADTRANQARTRAEIAALRDELAILTGSAPDALETMPGGPIPLPPAAPVVGDPAGMIARRPDIRLATCKLGARRGARAERVAALADCRAAVLAALRDGQSALGRYGAARITAARAQSDAMYARAVAASQTMRARAGTLAPGEAVDADRQALDALQAEEQARAAMTQAYVALAKSLGLGWEAPPGR